MQFRDGFSRVAVFGGSVHGNLGNHSWDLTHMEVECMWLVPSDLTRYGAFHGIKGSTKNDARGFRLRRDNETDNVDHSYLRNVSNITTNFFTERDVLYKINQKKYNNNWYLYEDDLLKDSGTVTGATGSNPYSSIGGLYNSLTLNTPISWRIKAKLYTFQLFELDSSGNRISELVNLDLDNGDSNSIPNIGANAPVSSDMIWVASGSGTYEDI